MKKLHIVTGAVLALAISAHGYGQGSQLPKYTVATLPSAASYKSFTVQVIDGISDTDCTVGGATGTSAHNALCSAQWNGSAYVWVPVASSAVSGVQEVDTDTTSGISGGPITDTGTIHCEQSSSSQFGCAKPDGTSITSTGGVYSASLTGSLEIQPPAPPTTGQYVFVPAQPTSSSGILTIPTGGPFEVNDSMTWGPPVLPSYIDPGNVTAIYATATYTEVNFFGWNDLMNAPGEAAFYTLTCAGKDLRTTGTQLTSLTGATFGTASCSATLAANYSGGAMMSIPRIGYLVYYTGTAPPADNTVKVVPPLSYNASTMQLGLAWPFNGAVDTGSVDALAVTIPEDPSTWSEVFVSPAFDNTSTTPRLSVNGATSVTILGPTGGALVAHDIKTTQVARFIKNLDGYWILENPQVSGGGGVVYPPAGVPNSTGSAWGTSYTVGTSANNLIQLNASAQIPAVSGALLTNLPFMSLTTTGTSGPATLSGGVLNIPQYSGGGGGITNINGNTASTQTFESLDSSVAITTPDGSHINLQATGGGGNALISRVNALSYGAVADGNLAANTGTDNTTAFTNCLTAAIAAKDVCYVPAGVYRIAGAMPSVTTGGTGFVGDVWGFTSSVANGTWPAPITQIFTSSSSATILTVSGGAGVIAGNSVKNIAWQRAVPPTSTATGLLFLNTPGIEVSKNTVGDSSIGMDISYAPTYGGSTGFTNNQVQWCHSSIGVGAGPQIGYNLHGTGGGFQTLTLDHNYALNVCGSGVTSYGFKLDGNITDLNMMNSETGSVSYGIYDPNGGQDIQITDSTMDHCFVDCIYIAGSGNSVEIRGGWATGADAGQTAVVELSGAGGVSVSDMKFYVSQGVKTIYNHGLQNGSNAILNNRFFLSSTGAQAIYANAGTPLNIVGNTVVGNSLTFTNPVIQFVNEDFSNIKANWLGNGLGTGIGFDAASDNNCCINLNSVISFTNSDAGTNNSFAATSAWGSITGTLSSQTDLQSALNAKAPTASPTFTGAVDASGATSEKLPVAAGCVTTADGMICYDSTNKNWHLWVNGVDKMLIPLAASFVSGHCGQPTLSGTSWEIQDAGGACGVSGGGSAFSAITTGTNTTATMTVGTGGSIARSGTGSIDASAIGGVAITGTPSAGMVPTATSSSAATWQAVTSSSSPYSALPVPPAIAGFTWVNQQTGATATQATSGAIDFVLPLATSLNWEFLKYNTALPSTPWSAQIYMKSYPQAATGASTFGFYLYDGTKLEGIENIAISGCATTPGCIRVERINSVTSDNSTVLAQTAAYGAYPLTGWYLRWCDTGTTRYAQWGLDGYNWHTLYSEATSAFMTPTGVGVGGVESTGTANAVGSLQGFQITSGATCP
jgi:hypothetical protein